MLSCRFVCRAWEFASTYFQVSCNVFLPFRSQCGRHCGDRSYEQWVHMHTLYRRKPEIVETTILPTLTLTLLKYPYPNPNSKLKLFLKSKNCYLHFCRPVFQACRVLHRSSFYIWSFLYKQYTSSLPLFQRNANKQTREVDRMLKQFRATVPFFSQMVCLLVLHWKRGRELVHCLYKKLQTCLPTSRRPGKPCLV